MALNHHVFLLGCRLYLLSPGHPGDTTSYTCEDETRSEGGEGMGCTIEYISGIVCHIIRDVSKLKSAR